MKTIRQNEISFLTKHIYICATLGNKYTKKLIKYRQIYSGYNNSIYLLSTKNIWVLSYVNVNT